jgi:OmpA-OmpF porin, OOP family
MLKSLSHLCLAVALLIAPAAFAEADGLGLVARRDGALGAGSWSPVHRHGAVTAALALDDTKAPVDRSQGFRNGTLVMPLEPTIVLSLDAFVACDAPGDELHLGASVATTNPGLRGEVAVRSNLPLVRFPVSVEVSVGARYPLAYGWELFAVGGTGLGSDLGAPWFNATAGFSFQGRVL